MCSAVALFDSVPVEAVIFTSDPVECLRLLSTLGLGVNRWRNPGESRHGLGASPLLHEGLLILPYDGSLR